MTKNFEIVALTFLGKRTGQYELRIFSSGKFGYTAAGVFGSRVAARKAAKAL